MWVAAILASLVVFTVLVLCVPLDMTLHIDVHGKPRFRMKLAWLFGLVGKEVTREKREPEEKKPVVEGRRKRAKSGIRVGTIFKILRTKGLLGQLGGLLRGIFGSLKIRELGVDFKVGLDNPADTGLLFAVIGPVMSFPSFRHQLRVQPSFDEAILEGFSYGRVRLRPIQLVPPFLRFAFSLAAARVLKTLVLSKWRRKK